MTAFLFSNHAKITCLPLVVLAVSTPRQPGVDFNPPTRSGNAESGGTVRVWPASSAGPATSSPSSVASAHSFFIRTSCTKDRSGLTVRAGEADGRQELLTKGRGSRTAGDGSRDSNRRRRLGLQLCPFAT